MPEHFASRGTRLAVLRQPGVGPTLLFLPGYASDMSGTKAEALARSAGERGRALIRFDYAGCGLSDGLFEEQTLATWLGNVLDLMDDTSGPVVLVGSSMGGWLALLAARARPERVAGIVGVAAAPDFTDWGFDEASRALLHTEGRLVEASPYGGETVTTRGFWESGQAHLLLGGEIAIDAPVRLLHGQEDADVPWQIAVRTAARLRSADVQTTLIKDGDHRLSRPQDIALLLRTVESLLEPA